MTNFKSDNWAKSAGCFDGLDVEKAIGFVEENGTELEKYRLSYLLAKERDDEVPARYLRGLQNDDGGFPYNNEKSKLSSVNSTSVNLSLMIELGFFLVSGMFLCCWNG